MVLPENALRPMAELKASITSSFRHGTLGLEYAGLSSHVALHASPPNDDSEAQISKLLFFILTLENHSQYTQGQLLKDASHLYLATIYSLNFDRYKP